MTTKKRTRINIKQAAEIFGTTTMAIYQKVNRAQIPYRRDGRRIYFIEEELYEFLDNAPGLRPEDIKPRSRW